MASWRRPLCSSGGSIHHGVDNLGGAVEAYLSSHFSGFPTAAPTPGSSTTSASASSSSTPARPIPGTSPCFTSPGTTTSTSRRDCPTGASAGSRESRISRRCSWRSTGTGWMNRILAPAGRGSCRDSPSWRTTARPRAAAGSTAACSPSRAATAPGSAGSPPTRCTPSGASPGRTTAASSTTAHRRTPTGVRGRSERSWSGGTRNCAGGSATTSRTSTPSCRRTTARRPAPRG